VYVGVGVGLGVDLNRPRDRDSQAKMSVERRETRAMRYPACSETEEFVGEAASGSSFLYGGIAQVVTSMSSSLTSRFDPLALFGRREGERRGVRKAAAATAAVGSAATAAGAGAAGAAAVAAGGRHCHRGSGRVQPRGCLRPLRSMGGRLGLWSGLAASSC